MTPPPPSGLGNTDVSATDIDQVRLDGVKVSALNALFGRMGLAILKPSYVPHRGFTECFDAEQGFDLFFGEMGHFQVKCRFEDSDACARFKAELIVEVGFRFRV